MPANKIALLLMLMAALAGAHADDVRDWSEFPVRSSGDLQFQADAMICRDPDSSPDLHIFLLLQEEDLTAVRHEERAGEMIDLEAQLTLLDARGRRLHEIRTTLAMPAAERTSTDPLAQRTISLRLPLHERPSGCEILLRDLNATRTGLIHQIRGAKRQGVACARLPRTPSGVDPFLGGPIFLRGCRLPEQRARQGEYTLIDAASFRDELEPNPGRIYGLFEPTVALYLELGDWPAVPTVLHMNITAVQDGSLLLEDESCLNPPAGLTGLVRCFSIAQLPAGAYRLTLSAQLPGDAPAQQVVRSFQVQWDPEAWQRPYRQRLEEAGLLMERDAWDRFRILAPGRQECMLESLWVAQAGSAREITKMKRRFRERVKLADARCAGWRGGTTEDRGRVLVHFGEPDEIHKALHPAERENLHAFLQEEIDAVEAGEHGGRPATHPLDQSSYEVWYFAGRGSPLFPGEVSPIHGQTLKFIFVDDMGTGRYRLIYTNLFGGFG